MPALLLLLLSIVTLILVRPEAAPPPPLPQHPPVAGEALFDVATNCTVCHAGIVTSTGEDVSIGADWRATMMANSARDPYWQAAVRRETMDHPGAEEEIEAKCATCHMPMAQYEAHVNGMPGGVFQHLPVGSAESRGGALAADGVSCTVCHQVVDEGLGDPSTFTGAFRVDETSPWGTRALYGPFTTDAGRAAIMRSATGFTPREGSHIQSSELCATCHTVYTEALDGEGRPIGRLPEQVPYLEWLHSAYPDRGQGCQGCHMPVVSEPVAVTGVLGQPRDEVSRHIFMGGNFFMLGMLNRFRDELGVAALPQELDRAQRRTVEHLQSQTASVTLSDAAVIGGTLSAEVMVENLAGHKLPTAYPSRRAWLHFTVRDGSGAVVFESGAVRPDGSIAENDNDADGALFEPHYELIESPDQVQIYEAIMVDSEEQVTTALLRGARYEKDNRILPQGFDKATADDDVGVQGNARNDPDFSAGEDRVRYRVTVTPGGGPFSVDVALWFQPIGFRWARALGAYDAFETNRFVEYYTATGTGSAVPLARDRMVLE